MNADGAAMIELRKVTKSFGARPAIEQLDLSVPRGEICGLLGHNGAGKSTAIGVILGQVWPDAGDVRVCGHDVITRRGLALQRVGAIFETPAFYDYLSGLDNLRILSSYTARTSLNRIREVIDWVGLTGRERSKVRTYSHGMRTRLALAQALLPEPDLLILDEPGDGLDPEGIHEMRLTIQRLHRELRLTILLSSHLLSEVEQLCTRIAVLKGGRKVFDGSLADATRGPSWIRLRTGDFAGAVRGLRTAGLVKDERDGQLVALAAGASTDQIVRHLVGQDIPVFEIAFEERTLEEFYLSLMNSSAASTGNPELRTQD